MAVNLLTEMPWEEAYQYYEQRKEEAYSRLKGNPLFQRFVELIEWRQSQTSQ